MHFNNTSIFKKLYISNQFKFFSRYLQDMAYTVTVKAQEFKGAQHYSFRDLRTCMAVKSVKSFLTRLAEKCKLIQSILFIVLAK
jgi:hypothetical protein